MSPSIPPFFLRLLPALLLCPAASAALVSHYNFDSGLEDSSGNGFHGSLVDTGTAGNSGVSIEDGNSVFGGGALALSAERDYVAVPSRTFSSGTAYTFAFWARKAPGDTGEAAQWDMAFGQRNTTSFFIGLNNAASGLTGLRWRSSDSSAARQADFTSPEDLLWHHHALAADTTGTLRYYLDGQPAGVASNKLTGFTYDTIGEAYVAANDFDLNGWMDEVWIFSHTLSAPEIANLHQFNYPTGVPPGPPAMLLHYEFSSAFTDSSPSANTGTPSGSAQVQTNPTLVGPGSLALDGQDTSYVALSQPISLTATSPWSVAFWAQRGELGANKGMVLGERATTDDFIWLNDTFTGLRFRSSTAATLDFTVAKDLLAHHYALVADGLGSLSLYVDSVFTQRLNGNTSFTIDTVGLAYTASAHYGFSGLLDDVRVYSGALDASDVLALYQLGGQPPPAGVAHIHVFLQAGQSNADGRADPAQLPSAPVDLRQPQADIPYYYRTVSAGVSVLTTLRPGTSATSGFGPEITFGQSMAQRLGADATNRVAILKYAAGGTSLVVNWKAGGTAGTAGDGPQYVVFQQTVTSGLAALASAYPGAAITVEGLTWMQGESDSGSAATAYAANLAAWIADLRLTYGADLPVVVARLSSLQTAVGSSTLGLVRQAQAQVASADAFTGWVDTDTFPVKTDNLHFDATGQQRLGQAFAYAMDYQLWVARQGFSSGQLGSGQAEPGVDADADGLANEVEFRAGTHPLDAGDVLAAHAPAATEITGGFPVRWRSAPGRRYTVLAAGNPGGTWVPLAAVDAAPAPATETEFIDPRPSVTPPQYYRIRLESP